MIYSIKVYNTKNTGDNQCDPLDYYQIPGERLRVSINTPMPKFTKEDAVIIGGGGLLDYSNEWNTKIRQAFLEAGRVVIWGAGQNRHYDNSKLKPLNLQPNSGLIGVRDDGGSLDYLPCPSCANAVFDVPVDSCCTNLPLLIHHTGRPRIEYCNQIDNSASMADIIGAIRRHRFIISETYHGTYWSMLLGRRVVVLRPFSSRFDRLGVPFSTSIEPAVCILYGMNEPDALLTRARELNHKFHLRVLSYLGFSQEIEK